MCRVCHSSQGTVTLSTHKITVLLITGNRYSADGIATSCGQDDPGLGSGQGEGNFSSPAPS